MNDHETSSPPGSDVPGDADVSAARRDVEAALSHRGMSLDDPALWIEPEGSLPAELLPPAIPAQMPGVRRPSPWRWAAAVVVLIAVVGAASLVLRDRPDWSVEAGPGDDFPLAAATIDGWIEGSGTRIRLEITGVEAAPDGYFYEMWMSEGPVHVSAGTFVEVGDIDLRAAVSRRDYPRLWVTLEPIDDDESPTRVVVIDTEP